MKDITDVDHHIQEQTWPWVNTNATVLGRCTTHFRLF